MALLFLTFSSPSPFLHAPAQNLHTLHRSQGNSGTWFDTAVLVTNVRNFPDDRGTVVGILKSFLGEHVCDVLRYTTEGVFEHQNHATSRSF